MLFDRNSIQNMRDELESTLSELGEKYNIVFNVGNIRYGTDHFKAEITCESGQSNQEAERNAFERECGVYGYDTDDYRRVFKANGADYYFVGFRNGARKYKYIGENTQTGERLRFSRITFSA